MILILWCGFFISAITIYGVYSKSNSARGIAVSALILYVCAWLFILNPSLVRGVISQGGGPLFAEGVRSLYRAAGPHYVLIGLLSLCLAVLALSGRK